MCVLSIWLFWVVYFGLCYKKHFAFESPMCLKKSKFAWQVDELSLTFVTRSTFQSFPQLISGILKTDENILTVKHVCGRRRRPFHFVASIAHVITSLFHWHAWKTVLTVSQRCDRSYYSRLNVLDNRITMTYLFALHVLGTCVHVVTIFKQIIFRTIVLGNVNIFYNTHNIFYNCITKYHTVPPCIIILNDINYKKIRKKI